MKRIRIEKVGDINHDYPYLEVFLKNEINPFIDIGITKNKQLAFKHYPYKEEIMLAVEDWEYILKTAKVFLKEALSNEDQFEDWYNNT